MSSVSNVGTTGLDITQLLKKLTTEQSDDNQKTRRHPAPADGAPPEGFQTKFGEALSAAGVSDEEVTTIQSEITTAIENATQNQNGDSDGRSGIKSAIDSVLEKHGLDPAEIQEQFRSLAGPPPGGPPPGANGANQSGDITSANSEENIIEQLLSSGEWDSETAQLLQALLPSLDATA